MIYTLTLNPSLDYLVDVDKFKLCATNRSEGEHISFGGKGINVSYVLKQLGLQSVCLGFTAGFTGRELEKMLEKEGIYTDFVYSDSSNTRINVKIKGEEITEINAAGPYVSQKDLSLLFEKLEKLYDGDILLLAGSLPKGVKENLYEEIMQRLSEKRIRVIVDTSGKKLLKLLKYKPFLIKPNLDELQELVGKKLENQKDIESAASDLQNMGAVNIIVSMGKDGALLLDEYGKVHKAEPLKITPVNATGAGDSMVAGFIAGYDKGCEYAIKLGNACGAATAESVTLAKKERIFELMK